MPGLEEGLKFELSMPLCTDSGMLSGWSNDGFESLMSSAMDLFDVKQYNSQVLFNSSLADESERFSDMST